MILRYLTADLIFKEWAKMGREALRLGGSELHHFVLAASCFLAASESAAGDEEAMQEGGSVVTPAQVQAALRAAVKAHKRFTGTLHSLAPNHNRNEH
jgi:hypothetical protein